MLERLTRLATRLRPHAWLAGVGAVAGLVILALGISVVSGATGQALALAGISLLLWALTLGAFVRAFAIPVPPPDPRAGLLRRLKAGLARFYRGLLAVMIAALLMLVIWFTVRAVLLISDSEPDELRVPDIRNTR